MSDSIASDEPSPAAPAPPTPPPHRRRPRYRGKYPRRFEEKYKELNPDRHPEVVSRVLAAGKTPAGTHRSIMVAELLAILDPQPGNHAVDCTLGYGGHASALLPRLQPGGRLLGLDCDPLEVSRTEARLRAAGFGPDVFAACRSNFAGLPQILARAGWAGADLVLADLGVSSMQLDNPARGFSLKSNGPLDMRMNPQRGPTAADLLRKATPEDLARWLQDHADEPRAQRLSPLLAGRQFDTTGDLAAEVHRALADLPPDERELSVRRVFQSLRIAVNDEFSALETFLRFLPDCLNAHGRVAILTFHSGEDRRVKSAFATGRQRGLYARIASEVQRATPEERYANPRAASAKLRWAVRAG